MHLPLLDKVQSLPRVLKWLNENPISDDGAIDFFLKTINIRKQAGKKARIEKASEKEKLKRNWTGKFSYLQII